MAWAKVAGLRGLRGSCESRGKQLVAERLVSVGYQVIVRACPLPHSYLNPNYIKISSLDIKGKILGLDQISISAAWRH